METTLKQTNPADRLSGGEIAPEIKAEFLKLRNLIEREEDVLLVLALSYLPEEGRWLYLIQTPFATWPKYVVGTTDPENANPEICFRCGHEENARKEFDALNMNLGDHL